MKLLHRMVLRLLPGPFLGALGTLMFLLLMQFLMQHLKDLVGKGLPLTVVGELISYNLVYMLVLAVPMSILLAVVAAFGHLASSGAYVVIKSAGISLPRLMWPVAVVGLALVLAMSYFNNVTLPEANWYAKGLWLDINKKRPGFALESGVFYEGMRGYSILALSMNPETNELFDVKIFDHSERRYHTVLSAERGVLETSPDGAQVGLTLYGGELHRIQQSALVTHQPERYERLSFDRHRMVFDLSEMLFQRSDPSSTSRSDRTMRTTQMMGVVDSLEADVVDRRRDLRRAMQRLGRPERGDSARYTAEPAPLPSLSQRRDTLRPPAAGDLHAGLTEVDTLQRNEIYDFAIQHARSVRGEVENAHNAIRWAGTRANRYRVEIHKKFSIALACLIFVLVGVPLGLRLRGGSLAIVVGASAAIFVFYWITLVLGEKLADPGYIPPWLGMWTANAVIGLVALWLIILAFRGPKGLRSEV